MTDQNEIKEAEASRVLRAIQKQIDDKNVELDAVLQSTNTGKLSLEALEREIKALELRKTNTEEELNKLKEEIQKNTFELGVLYLEKMELDAVIKSFSDKESELRNRVGEFKQKESELMNRILQKYGEGNLDIKNGIFTPS